MLVLDPITVILDNLPDDYEEMIEIPFSKDPSYGVCLNSLFINSSIVVTWQLIPDS